ncbi:MAG: metallophosphoesterase family protein [Ruminococcus sp.]|nr:metallophosphoesterase family protein [Ruminococcus sp.]
MKILAVSDVTSDLYYRYYQPGRLDPFDLILSCGDLNPDYIEFLVTLAHCPLVYVHGNHDDGNRREPEGCICADGRIVEVNGLRIMGLGGSYRYRDGRYMYTEKQMARRARGLAAQLRHKSGFDILLTHAPAYGLNDLPTLPHRGFECFNTLIEQYEPRYFIHGHVHRNYGARIPQWDKKGNTTVVNAYEHCVIDYQPAGT